MDIIYENQEQINYNGIRFLLSGVNPIYLLVFVINKIISYFENSTSLPDSRKICPYFCSKFSSVADPHLLVCGSGS